ncbi:tRNA-dihydrouridine synthase family protein [Fibrobacter sp. UWB10]|uniref:tRNA-dihydrouridine synthase family protein n=1 Tax=Fibrobacter sp. UWB10 TaxID=1896201 RepID=UPI002402FBFC|nr:tRNA-dihydrouridine synthase family protein [Fibrobacter sp. UWB10]SMP49701.1 tRNA-U20a,U20b-dihydrouridine synthase [Fibrobacter sp. UWB10]
MLPIHFAPLQGFTESAYRLAHSKFAPGIHTYYTPFLRLEKGEVRAKDLRDLQTEHPYHLVPQIIVRDVEEFNLLTKAVTELGFKEIDINMGCPYPMQTKSGRGSGILPHPEKVREILDAINQAAAEPAAASAPKFSIKMRLGLTSPEESLQLLPLLNSASLAHITLHPRIGIQQYKGALDFETFDKFYSECKHPLIFNGDITDLKQIQYIETRYPKLAGIMIGRGLLANPVLAAQYGGLPCGTATETLLKIHADIAADYARRLQGNAQILDKIRPFWTYADLPKKIRKKIEKSRTFEEYLEAVNELG